jgi:hypothetical protein
MLLHMIRSGAAPVPAAVPAPAAELARVPAAEVPVPAPEAPEAPPYPWPPSRYPGRVLAYP